MRDVEGAVAGEVLLAAIGEDEEAVALDRHVGELARGLEVALGVEDVDAGDGHAEADLGRVDAAELAVRRGRRRAASGESMSWKSTRPDLKPTVLTLAMLLPMTSIMTWWPRRPEMAENIERSTE